MERPRNKSMFLSRERDVWDHLAEEAWLHGELAAQLAAARQRITKITPTAEEVAIFESRRRTPMGMPLRLNRRPRP
jgi:hypothetical protein